MNYTKYHVLGNDYIVLPSSAWSEENVMRHTVTICHRHYGVGSDGVLFGPLPSKKCEFAVRILNPDGSEAEKSGNGLSIFSRFLFDQNMVGEKSFQLETAGGTVLSTVDTNGYVALEIGQVSFRSDKIPVDGAVREVINEKLQNFTFCAATVGNPHCVVLCDQISPQLAMEYGPMIENDPRFPHRTNVQFMKIINRNNIRIEIWERGAGYTLASGTSSTAAAAVAYKLGLCEAKITVTVPGGKVQVSLSKDFVATLKLPTTRICSGIIDSESLQHKAI